MKLVGTTFLFSTFLCSNILVAQNTRIDTMTFPLAGDLSFTKTIANYTSFQHVKLQDGNIISAGDSILIGIPASTETRISGTGGGLKTSATFNSLFFGSPVNGAILAGLTGDDGRLLGSWAKSIMVVEKVMVTHTKLSRNSPLNVGLVLIEPGGTRHVHTYNLTQSLSLGELDLLNRKMTRAEAIAKLKEAKDLMDLGMLTQEEYQSLMEELAPIIKGN